MLDIYIIPLLDKGPFINNMYKAKKSAAHKSKDIHTNSLSSLSLFRAPIGLLRSRNVSGFVRSKKTQLDSMYSTRQEYNQYLKQKKKTKPKRKTSAKPLQ